MAERRALHWRENDLLHERAGNFIHFPHLIHARNMSFNPLDWLIADEPFDEVSAQVSQQPSSKLDRNVNLKRKRQCKIWRFSWPKPVVSFFCSLARTKTNYVITGLVWPWTKLFINHLYQQFASYVSRTRINGSFRLLCKPRLFSRINGPNMCDRNQGFFFFLTTCATSFRIMTP